jgi:putative membrane protein
MQTLAKFLIAFVAIEHLLFLYVEMFAWETWGKKVFKSLPEHLFAPTRVLAANQGLYNGFLSAGLFWSLLIKDGIWANAVATFFLICVLSAALYGAYSASVKILVVQGIPAILALLLLILG